MCLNTRSLSRHLHRNIFMMATNHKGLHARSMETLIFELLSFQKTFAGYSSQSRQWTANSKSAIFVANGKLDRSILFQQLGKFPLASDHN